MTHLGELLSAHLDGELLDHERARVGGHLQECDRCRAELAELASARALVRSLPILEMPVAVREAVGMAPDPSPLRRHPGMWVGAAAAAAALVFVGAAIVTAPEPQQVSPPELSADLVDRGIVLTGGGALLKGIDQLVSEETGLPVHVAEDPLSAVAEGTGKLLDELDFLKKVSRPGRH